jgi:hypothetical protein
MVKIFHMMVQEMLNQSPNLLIKINKLTYKNINIYFYKY